MSRLYIMVCPWQKATEYTGQYNEQGDNMELHKIERFGTCYGVLCPFFDNITESCKAVNILTTLQR